MSYVSLRVGLSHLVLDLLFYVVAHACAVPLLQQRKDGHVDVELALEILVLAHDVPGVLQGDAVLQ